MLLRASRGVVGSRVVFATPKGTSFVGNTPDGFVCWDDLCFEFHQKGCGVEYRRSLHYFGHWIIQQLACSIVEAAIRSVLWRIIAYSAHPLPCRCLPDSPKPDSTKLGLGLGLGLGFRRIGTEPPCNIIAGLPVSLLFANKFRTGEV